MASNHTSKLIFFILVCYITIYSFYSELQRVKKATFSLSRLERDYYGLHGHYLHVYCHPDHFYCCSRVVGKVNNMNQGAQMPE